MNGDPPAGPAPGLRADARRNQRRILTVAARVLAADPTASTQRIADEAQVARPTVYRRYPTREALLAAIAQEAVAEFATALDAAEGEGADPLTALGTLVRALARIGADYPIVLQGSHLRDADAVARVDALIARGQAEGVVRADVTSDVVRHTLLGALSASLGLARGDASTEGLDAEAIGAQVAAILVDGLRAR